MIKLYYKNNLYKDFDSTIDDLIFELYYNLAIIVKYDKIVELINNNTIKITISLDKIKKNIQEAILQLSRSNKIIPMYDPFTKNIYLINYQNVYNRLVNDNYRVPSLDMIKKFNKIIDKLTKSNKDLEYIEKLQKNINFLSNYDLDILYSTFQKIIFETNPILNELTTCEKNSFLPYQIDSKYKPINPYYKKSELDNLIKNYSINDPIIKDHSKYCDIINEFEINAEILLLHQIYLNYNLTKAYVQFYSLLGSFLFNNYLRNYDKFNKDLELEKHIINFYRIINKAPEFNKNYTLFRFISNDDYLNELKINDIFNEISFISTTRNAFLDFGTDLNEFYVIKIHIPKNIIGIGISVEAYSLFSYEMIGEFNALQF